MGYSFFSAPAPKVASKTFKLPLPNGKTQPMGFRRLSEAERYLVRDRADKIIERYVPLDLRDFATEEDEERAKKPVDFPPVNGKVVTVTPTLAYQAAYFHAMQMDGPLSPNYWTVEELIAMCAVADSSLPRDNVAWFTLEDVASELELEDEDSKKAALAAASSPGPAPSPE
jgi:hypothetical protein